MKTKSIFKHVEIHNRKPEGFLDIVEYDDVKTKKKIINLISSPYSIEDYQLNVNDFNAESRGKVFEKVYNTSFANDLKNALLFNYKKKPLKTKKLTKRSLTHTFPRNLNVKDDIKLIQKLLKNRKKEMKNEDNHKFITEVNAGDQKQNNISKKSFTYTNPNEIINFFMEKEMKGVSFNQIKNHVRSNRDMISQESDNKHESKNLQIITDEALNFGDNFSKNAEVGILSSRINFKEELPSVYVKLSPLTTESRINSQINSKFSKVTMKNKGVSIVINNNNTQSHNNDFYLTSTRSDLSLPKNLTKNKLNIFLSSNFNTQNNVSKLSQESKSTVSLNSFSSITNSEKDHEVEEIELKNEKLENLIKETEAVTEPDHNKIREYQINTDKFIRTTMINGKLKTKYSKLNVKKTPSKYETIKSKYNQETISYRGKVSSIRKFQEKGKMLNEIENINLIEQESSKRNTLQSFYPDKSKKETSKNKIEMRKTSINLMTNCRNSLHEAALILKNNKHLKENSESKDKLKELQEKSKKGWDERNMDKKIKLEGLSEHKTKGVFLYGDMQGYHIENYERLYGIERDIKEIIKKKD